jgi:hypothetical protein
MIDRYVVSKSLGKRISCDGPLTAQIAECELLEALRTARQQPDVEIEYVKRPLPRARPDAGRKPNTKLRFK